MCGIIGYVPVIPTPDVKDAFSRLLFESTARGQHAYGLAALNEDESINLVKSFNLEDVQRAFNPTRITIAHTRYCQSGDWRVMENNQPLTAHGMAIAANGVISMGTKEEYEKEFNVKCSVDNDSEIFLQYLKKEVNPYWFIETMKGSFAAVWIEDGKLRIGRNERRPLWACFQHGAKWYASTHDIFKRAGFEDMTLVRTNEVIWA